MSDPNIKINKLFLENFQTIKDGVWIDLKPITIIVGPNSAGKSAIHDAIYLLEQIIVTNPDKNLITNLINRWIRIDENHINEDPRRSFVKMDKYAVERTGKIGIEIELEGGFDNFFEMFVDHNDHLMGDMNFETELQNKPKILSLIIDLVSGEKAGISNLELRANNEPLLSQQYIKNFMYTKKGKDILVDKPGVEIKVFCDNHAVNIGMFPEDINYKGGTLIKKWGEIDDFACYPYGKDDPFKVSTDESVISKGFLRRILIPYPGVENYSLNYFWSFSSQDDRFEFDSLDFDLQKVSNDCLRAFQYCFKLAVGVSRPDVLGNRTLPSLDDTLLCLNPSEFDGDWYNQFLSTIEKKINNNNINFYWELLKIESTASMAEKFGIENTNVYLAERYVATFSEGPFIKSLKSMQYASLVFHHGGLERVNRYLSEELFQDKGYQLQAQLAIINPYTFEGDDAQSNISNFKLPLLSTLYLVEPNGSKHQIDDVGSGIGYVLPVLVALSLKGLIKIQQPELHLHPALQSRLADCMIDALLSQDIKRKEKIAIIETHSEHIILRLLKRLKDKKSLLSKGNLSIIYLNPNLKKGSTEVKNIRLADDGTMVDQWPNGFFEERFEEHFGE